MHRQWQQQAEAVGGASARIVVQKVKAKTLIFDLMHDAFLPMNITQIHKVENLLQNPAAANPSLVRLLTPPFCDSSLDRRSKPWCRRRSLSLASTT